MNYLDWIVLFGTLIFIVVYGTLKTRGSKNIEGYLKGGTDGRQSQSCPSTIEMSAKPLRSSAGRRAAWEVLRGILGWTLTNGTPSSRQMRFAGSS